MDGLKISTAQDLLETGKTFSQTSKKRIQPQLDTPEQKTFGDTLNDAVSKVNEMQQEADIKMQKLATGENTNVSEVMIASEKADIAMKLMMSVRSKMIDAYQEIMKMQV